MRVLVIDIGGTHVKVLATGRRHPIKLSSGPGLTPARMVREVRRATKGWMYEAIAIGYPGPVVGGRPIGEPRHLARGWVGFDFRRAFGQPVRVINDAAMQALGSYRGGRMLFLGLGTGLGSALIEDGILEPMELGHLPYRKGRTFEEYLGAEGLERMGRKKWRRHVFRVTAMLKEALQARDVVIGGGNASHLGRVPAGIRLGSNARAFTGGYRLWRDQPHRPGTA